MNPPYPPTHLFVRLYHYCSSTGRVLALNNPQRKKLNQINSNETMNFKKGIMLFLLAFQPGNLDGKSHFS